MSVIPMCHCGLPARIHMFRIPTLPNEPNQFYLGCRKKVNPCASFMWCKEKNRANPDEDGAIELYDEFYLRNLELQQQVSALQDEVDHLKYMEDKRAGLHDFDHDSSSGYSG